MRDALSRLKALETHNKARWPSVYIVREIDGEIVMKDGDRLISFDTKAEAKAFMQERPEDVFIILERKADWSEE